MRLPWYCHLPPKHLRHCRASAHSGSATGWGLCAWADCDRARDFTGHHLKKLSWSRGHCYQSHGTQSAAGVRCCRSAFTSRCRATRGSTPHVPAAGEVLEAISSLRTRHHTQVCTQSFDRLEVQRETVSQRCQWSKVCDPPSHAQKPWSQVQQ